MEAWIRVGTTEGGVLDLLALGPEVEVLQPAELRSELRRAARRIAACTPATRARDDARLGTQSRGDPLNINKAHGSRSPRSRAEHGGGGGYLALCVSGTAGAGA